MNGIMREDSKTCPGRSPLIISAKEGLQGQRPWRQSQAAIQAEVPRGAAGVHCAQLAKVQII